VECLLLLYKARVVATSLGAVWKAIVHADVAYLEIDSTQVPALSLGLSPDASALPEARSLASNMAVQSLQSPQSLQTPSPHIQPQAEQGLKEGRSGGEETRMRMLLLRLQER